MCCDCAIGVRCVCSTYNECFVWSLYDMCVLFVVHVWFCGVAYVWHMLCVVSVCLICMGYHGVFIAYVVSIYYKCVVCGVFDVYVVYMWSVYGICGLCVCGMCIVHSKQFVEDICVMCMW